MWQEPPSPPSFWARLKRLASDSPWSVAGGIGLLLVLVPGLSDYWTYKVEANPHYHFVVIVPLAAIYLFVERGGMEGRAPASHPFVVLTLVGVTLGLGVLSTVLVSGTLAVLGTISLALALLLDRGGWILLRQVWPACIVLVLMVPLPLGLDSVLIFKLRFLASRMSEFLLDRILEVPHVLAGNVIHLESSRLFVADACSGINSLFSTVTLILFVLALGQRSWLHGLLLLGFGALLDLGLNTVRIVTIVLAYQASPGLGRSLESGPAHDLLGVGALMVLLLILRSFDALLRVSAHGMLTLLPKWALILIDPLGERWSATHLHHYPFGPPSLVASWIGSWSSSLRPEPSPRTASKGGPPRAPMRQSLFRRQRVGRALAELGGVAFLALMLVRRAGPSAPEGLEFPGIADHLPEVWDGWQRVVYEESVRSTEVVYAERGHRWIYKKDGLRLQVDLYYTYDHWHPFEACYRGVGWVIDEPRGDRFEAAGVEYPMVWFNGSLEGELHGQVAYSLFDPWRRETPVLMKSFAGAWSFLDQFRSRWNSLSTPAAAAGLVIILTEGGGTVTRGELSQVLRDRLSRAHERLFAGGGER